MAQDEFGKEFWNSYKGTADKATAIALFFCALALFASYHSESINTFVKFIFDKINFL